jgi:PPOX class probable F420-dependent enzyme
MMSAVIDAASVTRAASSKRVGARVRKTGRMDISDALAFASTHHQAVLVTRKRSGELQMSPVNAGVLDGALVISSRAPLAKVRNLRRNPTASLLVQSNEFYGSWVQIDGTATIVDQPDALPLLDDVYRCIAGEHPDWDDYRAAMIRDERVVIRIRPERAAGTLH